MYVNIVVDIDIIPAFRFYAVTLVTKVNKAQALLLKSL